MDFCTSEYFETIGSLQKTLHECEKRRNKLEEELFTFSRSEERQARVKHTKLRHYHKELCEREQQAKTRNLEVLKNAESLVLKAKEFSVDFSALHHLKEDCKNRITRLSQERKMRESERGLEAQKHEQSRPVPLSTEQTTSQPAIALMGWQPLKDTLVEDGIISAHSLIEPKPNHPSSSFLQSSPLMSAPVSEGSDNKSLSDDILNSNDFPERQPVFDCDSFMRVVGVYGSEQLASTHMTLKESGVRSHHGSTSRPESKASLQHQPSLSTSSDIISTTGSSMCRNSREQAEPESSRHHLPPILDLSKSRSSRTGSSDAEDTPEVLLASSRDVSVSLGESLDHQYSPIRSVPPIHESEKSKPGEETGEPVFPKPEHRMSTEEFFYLLDSIETRLSARDTELYSISTVSEQKLQEIISLCSQRGELRGEELSVCGAVVLLQLPCLLANTPHGCLLHSDLVGVHWSTAIDPAHIRSCLSGDGIVLWERWFAHALQLLQQEVLSLNSIVQLFTPLLVHYNASYADKAEVLLKRLLTHTAETHHSAVSEDSSSCSLPSLLNDSVEIKLARPFKKSISSAGACGEQSDEEDSTSQSPVESIPIRETKAYQLLKQSVTQENQWHNVQKEEENGSDLELSGLSDPDKMRNSGRLIQDLRNDSKKKTHTTSAVHSKAFWGDSDDTNSDIEMALRPSSLNTNNSDFDFYD